MNSESEMRTTLSGVVAQRGSLVFCRDPASFEMMTKLNNSSGYKGQLISTLFGRTGARQTSDSESSTTLSSDERLLFVRDIQRAEEEIQNWLDPFRRNSTRQQQQQATASGKKRSRRTATSSEESDLDDSDYSDSGDRSD